MMSLIKKLSVVTVPLALLVLPSLSSAEPRDSMEPVLKAYLQVQSALADDSLPGAQAGARRLAEASKTKAFAELGKNVAKAKNLVAAREAFKPLSENLVNWAREAKPSGARIYFCSMVGAHWLQAPGETANPYYGKEMRSCGEKQE